MGDVALEDATQSTEHIETKVEPIEKPAETQEDESDDDMYGM